MEPEFNPNAITLVVGLGNPGARYARTYHNAGRIAACGIAGAPESAFRTKRSFLAYPLPHAPGAEPRAVVLTNVFMNESGKTVADALRAFRVPTAKPSRIPDKVGTKFPSLLVVHDDADLALGTTRLHYGRGSAGHRGVESVIAAIGTKNFWRLRIGVRPPLLRDKKADEFVLKPMPREARDIIIAAVERFRDRFFVVAGAGDVTLRTRE